MGGISRTETYKGYRFDIGGHRFYTKVGEIQQLWREILGNDFLKVPRLSRIYIACYGNGCLPLHDWAPLMLQMQLWKHWRNAFKLIVANSQAVKHYLVEQGIEPVEVILNGIPVRPVRPPLKSPPTVAFAGRLVWEKGVDVLIQSFAKVIAKIPDALLLIAGEGEEHNRLVLLIRHLRK